MLDGPKRVVGPGESLNIIHPSLSIEGFLTDNDKDYIEAGNNVGISKYMLSFVENADDVKQLQTLVPGAEIAAKIESRKGMRYVANEWDGESRLMTARGDLFVELRRPHHITAAMEDIVTKDPNAILASRIFSSFAYSLEPSCSDIGDVDNALRMGYRTFMLGDATCMNRDSVISSLNLFEAMGGRYK